MGTEIRSWQISDGKLRAIDTALKSEHIEQDLEGWIESNPAIVGSDILIIGRQVPTKSGPIDLLAVDRSGNTVIIEIKRGELPRECLAQAIDYASDVAEWTVERLDEECSDYAEKPLEDALAESFPEIDLEALNLNSAQRIVLVGFSIESSLERMIEWLSESYGVNVNAIVLSYVKTSGGDELLTRTSIISEEMEEERRRKQRKFGRYENLGTHDQQVLRRLLYDYLSSDKVTSRRMRDIIFPALLKAEVLSREQLKKAFVEFDPTYDESKVGFYLTLFSGQLSMKKNDFLRQVISYEHPRYEWGKDNYSIRPEYRDLVKRVLDQLKEK